MTARAARARRASLLALALLLALFAARLVDTAERTSLTLDEPLYIGTGLYLWQTGDYHFAKTLNFQPPLAFHLASVPLLFLHLDVKRSGDEIRRSMHDGSHPNANLIRIASRLPFVLLACWGALLVYVWARELAGDVPALLATALYTLSPTILANAPLAHSDITVTVFFLQTLWALWRWQQRPTWTRLLVCGLSLGLALAAKLSALLLLPAIGLLVLQRSTVAIRERSALRVTWPTFIAASAVATVKALVVLLAAAVFVVWLSYGGSFAVTPGLPGIYEHLRLPAYLHPLLFDVAANDQGRELFFFGRYSHEGWWYFFPVVYAIKTPLAALVLLFLALTTRRPALRSATTFLAIPLLVYLLVACFWVRVPMGLRYILPVIPLLQLFVAIRLLPTPVLWRRIAVALAVAWLAVTGALIHPDYLAYFNGLIGGPTNGYRVLAESSLDWGQSLPALASYLHERGDPVVKIAYSGPERPAHYGIRSEPLRGCEPVAGTIAISVNVLRGLYSAENPFKRPPRGCYDWLLSRTPVAEPGYSILVYDVPESPS